MGTLTIERIGGIAGFGLPGSRIKSGGQLALERLSAADLKSVNELFAGQRGQSASRQASPVRDGFAYRITRSVGQTVECVEIDEAQVPAALLKCVKDRLV
jgi:hypothetical protein